ncbi:unnamed protein product, partial [Lampetra planeri]
CHGGVGLGACKHAKLLSHRTQPTVLIGDAAGDRGRWGGRDKSPPLAEPVWPASLLNNAGGGVALG